MNLESLIHAKLDGEITPEQHAQLEALLRDDWQARRLYLELADQHARLLQQPEVNTGRLKQPSVISRTVRWRTSALIASAAAIVLLALAVWPRTAVDNEATSNGVAMVSQTLDAEFAQTTVRSGDTIAPGKLTLNKGLAQIEFFSGATVLIEGATQIEILSAWEARCVSGRVRVHVPPAAKGFLMHGPDVKLEDLGTEFALNVTGQDSAVHVFDGEVIAHTKDKAPASLKVGMSLASTTAGVSPQDFLPISELQGLIRQREQRRFQQWQIRRANPRAVAASASGTPVSRAVPSPALMAVKPSCDDRSTAALRGVAHCPCHISPNHSFARLFTLGFVITFAIAFADDGLKKAVEAPPLGLQSLRCFRADPCAATVELAHYRRLLFRVKTMALCHAEASFFTPCCFLHRALRCRAAEATQWLAAHRC